MAAPTITERNVTTHELSTRDGAKLVLTRVPARGQARAVAVLVHGSYTNRRFWLSPKGVGLGAFLADGGVDCWLLELRGHGLSPKPARFRDITAEQHVRFDIPAAVGYVHEATGARPFALGHSAGGLYTLAALAMDWLTSPEIAGVVTLGSQIALGESYLKSRAVRMALESSLRLLGKLPATRLGLGPEDEPAAEILEFIRWKTDGWTSSDGRSYADGLARVTAPLLAFGSEGDRNDPIAGCRALWGAVGSTDKTFVSLGKRHGFDHDYSHAGMVISKPAQREVWPLVLNWLVRDHHG